MDFLRTPDERFVGLPDWSFAPRYLDVDGLRVHYVDEGPRDAPETVVLLHGEPTWSYLWRNVLPSLVAAGHRVVAPDMIGFGRSDKPVSRDAFSYERLVAWARGVFDALAFNDVTLVLHDWGGLVGLRLVAEAPARYRRVVAANTFLPTGDERATGAFLAWQRFSQEAPKLVAGNVVKLGTMKPVPPAVLAAYDAPFPDERYQAAARALPLLVPTRGDDPASAPNRAAWEVLRRWERPLLTVWGSEDPITFGFAEEMQARVPGAKGQKHVVLDGAGHFLQEDRPQDLARAIVEFIAENR